VIGPSRRGLAAAVAALALLASCSSSGARQAGPSTTAAARTPDRAASGLDAARGFQPARNYQATPVPVRLEIPRIHVASPLERLDRAADGTVEVPSRWEVAGWYALGPRPGDPGSAVILGHVDSKRGPAVFYRLRELRPGDEIDITRADRSSARFVVERTAMYDKRRFPTDEVYYPTLVPALRLVTCGGQFDFTTGHYRSNIIVFATIRT
jgi:sortase (surface protein transpeptidase)